MDVESTGATGNTPTRKERSDTPRVVLLATLLGTTLQVAYAIGFATDTYPRIDGPASIIGYVLVTWIIAAAVGNRILAVGKPVPTRVSVGLTLGPVAIAVTGASFLAGIVPGLAMISGVHVWSGLAFGMVRGGPREPMRPWIEGQILMAVLSLLATAFAIMAAGTIRHLPAG